MPRAPGSHETLADRELRQRAIKRLKDKRDLKARILAYVTVNLLLVGIWAATGAGFFGPSSRCSAGASDSRSTSGTSSRRNQARARSRPRWSSSAPGTP